MTTNKTPLTDTQREVLTTACTRKGRLVLPLTLPLKGGAVKKVVESLISKGFVAEIPAAGRQEVWRTAEDGAPMTLKATAAAYEALGLTTPKRAGNAAQEPATTKQRADTKQAKVIAMLKQPNGATIPEIVAATEWQPHTVRGFFAGALKKRLGIEVTSEKVDGRGRVYRMLSA
jgi:hypothetical protein